MTNHSAAPAAPHSADALKPCPFCGDEMKIDPGAVGFATGPGEVYVICDCGAMGAGGKDQDEAIAAWNRRPTPADCESKTGEWSACQLRTIELYNMIYNRRPLNAERINGTPASPDLVELRAKAEAAGSEAWNDEADADGYVFGSDGDSVCICHANMGHMPEPIYPEHRAAFIAAANPAAILALLDRVERAEADAKHYSMGADAEAKSADEWRERALRAEAAAGAVPEGFKLVPITEMQGDTARQWAWDQVRRDCDDSNWTVGESGTYYGFFLHGWHYRKQYESQLAAPPAQGLPAAPTTCTCPSGDGSLRWPCPTHPPAAAPSEPVAWMRPAAMEPEFTSDAVVAGYWMRKGSTVTPLAPFATPPAQDAGTGDATIVAIGYESGFMATDPDHDGATVKLHYRDEATAEAAFCAITRIIDRAIANSGRTE